MERIDVQPVVTTDTLLLRRVGAGIASAVATAIPVPLVGAHIVCRCDQFVVEEALAASGRKIDPVLLRGLYANDSQWSIRGFAGTVARFPHRALAFPIRNLISIAKSVKDAPLTVLRAVLLGRTIDRVLSRDFLMNEGEPRDDFDFLVKAIRTSFEQSFAAIQWRIATATISEAISKASSWQGMCTQLVAKYRDSWNDDAASLFDNEKLRAEAENIRDAVQQPIVLRLFENFDLLFDDELSKRANGYGV